MKKIFTLIFFASLVFNSHILKAQDTQEIINDGPQKPTLITKAIFMGVVPSLASQIADGTFKPAEDEVKEFNPKRWGSNTYIPGKGLPKGNDPLWEQQNSAAKSPGKAPILTFEAASATATPTDPTGAVGPNHFVNSWNSSFRIWDKAGNPLTAAASLGTILPGTMGDPIVMYDRYADRFLITEFYSNGFDVAISQGANPVTSGWYVYRFPTNTFPDYPKFTVWSDGYYITANKDQGTAASSQVVFVLERDKMIAGNTSAQMVGFPLTGIVTSGFYSPLGFNANGPVMPPAGNAPIVYMQDDAWSGVTTDHLKIWSINVNWTTPASSTISSPQILNTQPFDGLFDGGSFSNLPQPSGSDIDALQATIMYMAQYRRFSTYNCAVFNFVVDLNGADNYAGIRWFELRQSTDGAPWTIYQEGTYSQPGGQSAFSGTMCMDANGNIGMAYTIVGTTQYPSLRFTGRYASDPLGTMTLAEEVIATGTQVDPSSRYGDYAQMTIDPVNDATFWSIGEYFNGGRKNQVGVFQIAPPALTAQFSAAPTTICSGGTVTFTDLSIASPTAWEWSFPGGTPSTWSGQNPPTITYSAAGTYDVILTVTKGTTTDVETKTGYIKVKSVIANFSGTPASVIVGNSVTFTDNSSCNPTSWEWSFPGGTPSSFSGMTPPPVTYNAIGTYDVSLTVAKPGGTDTKTATGYVNVMAPEFNMSSSTIATCTGNFYDPGGAASAYSNSQDFTMVFNPGAAGNMLKFIFNSFALEANTTCSYDYLKIYNGNSTSASLIGTYCGTTSPGTVTANNATGSLTFVFHSDGSVTAAGWAASISCISATQPPVAQFTASTTAPAINTSVTFTDQSTNLPTSWAWSFSPNTVVFAGGTSATSQNPQVQFTALGQYTVTLVATNAYGSDNEIKAGYITVSNCSYCTTSFTNLTDDYISNVTLNTINNTSGSTTYSDFTAINTILNQGTTTNISVSVTVTGAWIEHCIAWIDWNNNCSFADAGETFDLGQTPGTAGTFVLSGTVTVPESAVIGSTRMRVSERYSQNPGSCDVATYGEAEDYTIIVQASTKTLNLSVFLEGLYNGGAIMRKAQNATGDQFTGTVADQVTVELHNSTSPYALAGGPYTVNLNTDGSASVTIPAALNSSYYVVIKHRNSIETWSASPVSFSGSVMNLDFTGSASQAFGNNLKLLYEKYVLYTGDVNQDGFINTADNTDVHTDATSFTNGYRATDANGDGVIDSGDFILIDNNAAAFVSVRKP